MADQRKKDPKPQGTPVDTQSETRDRPIKPGFSVEGGAPPEEPEKPSKSGG